MADQEDRPPSVKEGEEAEQPPPEAEAPPAEAAEALEVPAEEKAASRPASAKSGKSVTDVVSQVTVQALKEPSGEEEFKLPDMPAEQAAEGGEEQQPTEQPAEGEVAEGEQPGDVEQPEGAEQPEAEPSQPVAEGEEAPAEAPAEGEVAAEEAPPAEEVERPMSGTKPPSKPTSRAGSARSGGERPGSGRPGSGRPGSGRPAEGERPPSGPRAASEAGLSAGGVSAGMISTELPTGMTRFETQPGMDSDLEEGAEEMEEAEEGYSDTESEGESEMVVLDPDHPLMLRFQRALNAQLSRQNQRITLELKEMQEATKSKHQEREDLGVQLYGLQQELARNQMNLERKHDTYANVHQAKQQAEEKLEGVRLTYKDVQQNVLMERTTGAKLQTETENLATRLLYMQNAKEDVRSDIAVMKRAAEKADTEVAKAELAKKQQDLYIDRLVDVVDDLREKIALYEAQIAAQTEETKAAREAVSEARTEIDAINLEKKQLFQQWTSSLIGMRRRDEAHAAMNQALDDQRQRVLSLETEIDGYKKSITKEQEKNETLTMVLNKTESDISTTKKLMAQSQTKQEAIKAEYTTYTRALHETEQALNRATTDRTLRLNELNALRKQIEREYQEKVNLEDAIMEKMRSQLTMDKAALYTKKMTSKLRQRKKQLEAEVAKVENEISRDILEISYTTSRIKRLQKTMEELDEEIRMKNDMISKSEGEIIKRNAVIERKQGVIDQYNKRVDQLLTSTGGEELGPLEIQIKAMNKQIEDRQAEIMELQQFWLRQQGELVKLTKDREEQGKDLERLKKQLSILTQKKLRIENEIEGHQREQKDIDHSISNMRNDMVKLNTLLTKENKLKEGMQQDNILVENDFIAALREAEHDSISMQERLEALQEEKERLLNSLVEAERQIMLWEKKTQLAREVRSAVDSEVGQGEIHAMKAEIHRMEVRYSQLMKQQEKMIRDMESAVSRRDTIWVRGDAQAKTNKKVVTQGNFQKKLGEMRKKIKQTAQDANGCDREIQELRQQQQELSKMLEDKQITCQQLQSSVDTLEGDIDNIQEIKERNLAELVSKQQKVKHYQALKDGKYKLLCRTETALENETQKQLDRMQTLNAIVDRLNQEYPHAQPALRRVTLTLQSRGVVQDSA
ncbi:coiled-coil domain-containing protein 40-like [Branchiostoma floridae]|uniref:Coiled-coil domain-containing protein 40-like n=1 Tax=Branchiostoma floridae TaxID=7739 RepID=A0A9J7M7G3_BRAFL|nr:coiled-coil domain-containing protein 40-like [Branchiostoma floridae]